MSKKKLILSILIWNLFFADAPAGLQQTRELNEALNAERSQTVLEFIQFEEVLKTKPMNMVSLLRASRLASDLGGSITNGITKTAYIQKATVYAQRSIEVDPKSKEAHLNYIIALGLLSETVKGPAEKLKHAKIIKQEADYLLFLDSLYAPAHFTLGKWHLSLASLSWLERTACELLIGDIPKEASLEAALGYFERAIQLQPGYILFHYNKALALQRLKRYDEAVKTLTFSVKLPILEPNDKIRKNNCIALLNDLNHSTFYARFKNFHHVK